MIHASEFPINFEVSTFNFGALLSALTNSKDNLKLKRQRAFAKTAVTATTLNRAMPRIVEKNKNAEWYYNIRINK